MTSAKYVYKIESSKPDLESSKVELTDLDVQSGFIHLSTGQQIPKVCDLFFSAVQKLYILKFPYDKVKANMKWEAAPGGEELFPHLYADLLIADVDSVREFDKGQGAWSDVLGKEKWLE